MIDKFYKLSCNFDRFGDPEDKNRASEDGYLDWFEGCEELKRAFFHCTPITLGGDRGIVEYGITKDDDWRIVHAQMPEEIIFAAERKHLTMTDFPNLEDADYWPVMSRKMVDVLLSVGDFPHQIIPVAFVDHSDIPIECDYVILHPTELSDFLDLDKSIYTREPVIDDPVPIPNRTVICNIEKLVLKEPKNGFPPMFRVKHSEVYLFISAAAKTALEAAGIQGLSFTTLEQLYHRHTYD